LETFSFSFSVKGDERVLASVSQNYKSTQPSALLTLASRGSFRGSDWTW